jgi:LPS sulfotransferase NodH
VAPDAWLWCWAPTVLTKGFVELAPNSFFIICATPRCGSTLLCEALEDSGVGGRPREYFDDRKAVREGWKSHFGITEDSRYLAAVSTASTSPNGVCGFKVHWHQLDILSQLIGVEARATGRDAGPSVYGQLVSRFAPLKFVWLRRRNKIAQGISLYKADKTGVWRHRNNHVNGSVEIDLEYDENKIINMIDMVSEFDKNWEAFLRSGEVDGLELYYEDIILDYPGAIRETLALVGQTATATPRPRLRRQADETTRCWEDLISRRVEQGRR